MRIFLFSEWSLERDRLLRDLEHLAHLGDRDVHALCDLFRGRFTPKLLHQLTRSADKLVDGLDHVHWNTDGAGLIRNRARDRLANPPRRIRGELVATAILELVHCLHQADIAFLNQVEELKSAIGIFLRDRNNESQVGLDELALRAFGVDIILDDFALRAAQFLIRNTGLVLQLLEVALTVALLPTVFLLSLL